MLLWVPMLWKKVPCPLVLGRMLLWEPHNLEGGHKPPKRRSPILFGTPAIWSGVPYSHHLPPVLGRDTGPHMLRGKTLSQGTFGTLQLEEGSWSPVLWIEPLALLGSITTGRVCLFHTLRRDSCGTKGTPRSRRNILINTCWRGIPHHYFGNLVRQKGAGLLYMEGGHLLKREPCHLDGGFYHLGRGDSPLTILETPFWRAPPATELTPQTDGGTPHTGKGPLCYFGNPAQYRENPLPCPGE